MRAAFGMIVLPLCAATPAGPTPVQSATGWQEGATVTCAGYRVTLSRPNLVARSKQYLWFPTLVRTPDKTLFAVMSNYADEANAQPTAMVARSADGGLHWSTPGQLPYGESAVTLGNGDMILLPYYMRLQEDGSLAGPYLRLQRGKRDWIPYREGITVTHWPRKPGLLPPDLGHAKPEDRLGSFVFNGQTARTKDRRTHLATLYGRFAGTTRYSLLLAESRDGVAWRLRAIIADETCRLAGAEGPCESALVRLKDGRLMCVFRMHSGLPYGQSYSADEGLTWSEPEALNGPRSVQPSIAALPGGSLVLAGGRPDLYLWINRDGEGKTWERIDLLAHHNTCCREEPIQRASESPVANTSSYTEVVALDARTLLVIYDRVPRGWDPIPADSRETNSVWVVRVTLR